MHLRGARVVKSQGPGLTEPFYITTIALPSGSWVVKMMLVLGGVDGGRIHNVS